MRGGGAHAFAFFSAIFWIKMQMQGICIKFTRPSLLTNTEWWFKQAEQINSFKYKLLKQHTGYVNYVLKSV